MTKKKITSTLIAPCGMNCTLCSGYHREKNPCAGCNIESKNKPQHCQSCSIKNCEHQNRYCSNCTKYPCTRLKSLDKRYREKYHMSMLENLDNIKRDGIREFVKAEQKRWTCTECGHLMCVHKGECVGCGKKI